MTVFVKDGGSFREISELFVRDSTSYTNKTITNAYIKDSGSWREIYTLFTATSYVTEGPGTHTITVPSLANAIHIQFAVAGGSGGMRGADYDKAGGESAGPAGASGGYISDVVYQVTGGETLTAVVGAAGSKGTGSYSGSSGAGGNTTLTGTSSANIFTLTGGGAASVSGGGVQGPLRSNNSSTAGTGTSQGTRKTTFTTTGGLTQASTGSNGFTGGPVGTFNQLGDGNAGTNPGNCGGDNCTIGGGTGGSSYGTAVSGGAGGPNGNTNGQAGTRGSGGGGGGTEPGSSSGGDGGPGEFKYRFLRTT